jgi:hypothetical protein
MQNNRIMKKKITLILEKSLIKKAEKYANEKGFTLSEIVDKYLEFVIHNHTNIEISKTPISDSLRGILKSPDNFNYDKALIQALSDKYLKEI